MYIIHPDMAHQMKASCDNSLCCPIYFHGYSKDKHRGVGFKTILRKIKLSVGYHISCNILVSWKTITKG